MSWSADTSTVLRLNESRQLVLVIAHEWSSSAATLRRFERMRGIASWKEVSAPIRVSIGRSGLGWGVGLHGEALGAGPVKREGDGRSPAGIFALTALFGSHEPQSLAAKTAKLPYWHATPDLQCVDDSASGQYNRLVYSSAQTRIDWKSHEDILRDDGQYAWGIMVAHNLDPTMPNAGSCIFMHVWESEDKPTAGCTAGAASDIAQIFLWLKQESSPMLVQLPQAEYLRLKSAWNLP